MRGLYTAGVLDVMMDNSFHPDVICGTSAGVTFGINLPSGQKGRVIRYNLENAGRRDFVSLFSWLTTGNVVNVPFSYDLLPRVLDPFDNEKYMNSGTEFYATVTNLLTGQAEYLKVEDCFRDMDYIRASASLPFMSRKVMINGVPYLDGGIADNIPLDKCLEMGCDHIYVVLTKPKGYVRKGNMASLGRLFYWRYPNLIKTMQERTARYNDCLAKIARLEAEGKITVLRPSVELGISRLESDRGKMRQMYDLGIADARVLFNNKKD